MRQHSVIDIYLTAIGLPPSGSSTVHIYTQTIHRTTQSTQTTHRTTQSTQTIHRTTQSTQTIHRTQSTQTVHRTTQSTQTIHRTQLNILFLTSIFLYHCGFISGVLSQEGTVAGA